MATENGLDNSPGETELAALKRLAVDVLEPLRECLGAPIIVTSGFRNPAVNRLVGGVAASQHTKGEAADVIRLSAHGICWMFCSKTSCLSLILFSSCASRKMSDRSVASSDSLRRTTRLSIRQMAIPESRADLQIPAAGLRGLPPAAVYTARSGQATATVRFLYDTLFVSASCDSLQQLVYDYQQQVERLSVCSEHEEKTKERSGGRRFLWGILLAVAAYLAGRLRYEMFK